MENQDPTIVKVDDSSFKVVTTQVNETVIDVPNLISNLANANAQIAAINAQLQQARDAGIDVDALIAAAENAQ